MQPLCWRLQEIICCTLLRALRLKHLVQSHRVQSFVQWGQQVALNGQGLPHAMRVSLMEDIV